MPQPGRLDCSECPISALVAVQASENSEAALDKLGGSGILLADLVAAAGGVIAVLSFSDEIHVRQNFTSDARLWRNH